MLTPQERAELEQLRSMAQQGRGQQPGWRGLAQSGLQGLSLGFGDEAVAGGIAALSRLNPEETRSFGDVYRDVHGSERAGLEQYRERNPVAAFGAEAGGALLTAPMIAARALQGASALAPRALGHVPRLAAPVAAGVAEGAAYGAGAADIGERGAGAATGAALGGTLGGAMGLAQKALSKPLGWLWRQATSAPNSDAQRVVTEALKEAGYSPSDVLKALDELGPDARLADLGGGLGALGDVAASSPGGARYVAELAKRHRNQYKEVLSAFESTAEMRPKHATQQSLKKLAADAQREVKPIYDNLVGTPILSDGGIRKILSAPEMRPIFRMAKRMSGFDDALRRRTSKAKFDIDWKGVRDGSQELRIEHMDYLQRALREKASDLRVSKKSSKRAEGLAYREMRENLLDDVDPAFPEFARARSIWAGRRRIEAAVEKGRRFNTMKDFEFDVFVDDVPRVEKEAFLMGVHDTIRETLSRIRRGRDLSVATNFDTPQFERRMSLLLGPKPAQELAKRLEAVRQKAMTYGRTRNSTTFPRQAMERKLRDEAGGSQFASDLMTGNVVGAGARMLRDTMTRQSLDPQMLEELARLTLGQGGVQGLNLGSLPGVTNLGPGFMVRGPAGAAALGQSSYNALREPR